MDAPIQKNMPLTAAFTQEDHAEWIGTNERVEYFEEVGVTGLEPTRVSGSDPRFCEGVSHNAALLGAHITAVGDQRLARFIAAWDELNEETRSRMFALLE